MLVRIPFAFRSRMLRWTQRAASMVVSSLKSDGCDQGCAPDESYSDRLYAG